MPFPGSSSGYDTQSLQVSTPLQTPGLTPQAQTSRTSSLIFVDAGVQDAAGLISARSANTEVIYLNTTEDAIDQITRTLLNYDGISTVHLFSHGDNGRLNFSSGWLATDNLSHYTAQIKSWSQALSTDADILLYGCDVAGGVAGAAFIRELGMLTQADIAASTNKTGKGGDWNLEAQTGSIEAAIVPDQAQQMSYGHSLDAIKLLSQSNSTLASDAVGGAMTDKSVSADGKFIVFSSAATNLVAGDTNNRRDVYLYDRSTATPTTTLISSVAGNSALSANGDSIEASISKDGRYVVFLSNAKNLTTDVITGTGNQLYRWDKQTNTTILISKSATAVGNGSVSEAVISDDGSSIAFISTSSNLSGKTANPFGTLVDIGDANGIQDAFLWRQTEGPLLISMDRTDLKSDQEGVNSGIEISGNGKFVTFNSGASLTQRDRQFRPDIYVYDVAGIGLSIASFDTTTDLAFGASIGPAKIGITSTNKLRIVFSSSFASIGDTNGTEDVFLAERDLNIINSSFSIIKLVSLKPDGETSGTGGSSNAVISADGRYIAFTSSASDLVTGDTNAKQDVFIRDLDSTTPATATRLISRNSSGGDLGDGNSSKVRISDDGNIVTFTSVAKNFVANDTNAGEDVFAYNRTADTLTLVSQQAGAATTTAALPASQIIRVLQTPIVSGDGLTIVYANNATNIVAKDTNDIPDIFAFNVATPGNTLVTTVISNQNSVTGAGSSTIQPIGSVSKDGRYVVFSSTVNSLVTGDANAQQDVFLRDTTLPATDANSLKLISRSTVSTKSGNGISSQPFISADGKYVVFSSTASDLQAGDTNSQRDIFLYDVTSGAITTIVSRTAAALANGGSDNASVATDASGTIYVAFTSSANNLGPTVSDGFNNVYLWKKPSGGTETIALLSRTTAGAGGNQNAFTPIVSADGKYVAFSSVASNLDVAGTIDTNSVSDVFLYDITANTLKCVSQSAAGVTGTGASFNPVISDIGGVVAFESNATNLVTAIADTNNAADIFRSAAGVVSLVSVNAAGTAAGLGASGQPAQQSGFTGVSLSADGSAIAFTSAASDLSTTADTNSKLDVFVRDFTTNKTTLISQVANASSNGASSNVVISGDGKTVAFISTATNLSPRDADAKADVYVSSTTAPAPGLISSNVAGAAGSDASAQTVSLNREGGFVVFDSGASNLIANDANGFSDVFLRPTKSIVTLKATTATATEGSTTANGVYELARTDTTGSLQVKIKLDTLLPSGAKAEDFILTAADGTVIPIALGLATITFADSISKVTLTLKAIADSKAEADETAKFTIELDSTYTVDPVINTGTVTIAANETIVTTNADTGEGSLRQAIANANAFTGPDTISFALADPTQKTIALATELAALNTGTVINGGTAGIVLDGALAGATANGLTLTGDSNTVNSVTIQNFKGNGIVIAGNNNTIGGLTAAVANTITLNNQGVVVQSGTGNRILGNKISTNTLLGIDIAPIGPDATPALVFTTALPNATGAALTGALTKPAGTYRVEFFANAIQDTSLQGEGEIFLGFKDIVVDTTGSAVFTFDATTAGLTGKYITATVTDAAGSTSEFAKNKLVTPPLPLVELTASVPELLEGKSGVSKYKFNVTLSQPSPTPLTLNYRTIAGTAASGIATPGTDYTAVTTGTVTIDANASTASFEIDITGDTRYEVDETFQVELFDINATVLTSGTIVATGRIKNDDSRPTISFGQAAVSQAEGQVAPNAKMPFTVNLSNASDETITVAYKTIDGTAISTAAGPNPADFIPIPTTTLTFTPGEITKELSVELIADTLDEPSETFSVELSAPTNATFAASAAQITALGTITPDEQGYVFSVLPLATPRVNEGASGTTQIVTFTVSLDRIPTENLTVKYSTVDGSARAGRDYVDKTGTLTFPAGGPLTQTVEVVVNGDDITNFNRDFTLELREPTEVRATIDPTKKTSLVTIVDDDLPKISFNTTPIRRIEGPNGQTTQVGVVVKLSAVSAQNVTVEFTTLDGTAPNAAATIADNDYVARTAAGQKITILAGSLDATASFTINGDDRIEADETFFVKLSNATGAVIDGPDTKSIVIVDDDQAIANRPNVSITATATATQTEGNSGTKSYSFTVTLDKQPATGKDVTVQVQTVDGLGSNGAISTGATPDFTAKTQNLTFIAGGALFQTFTVLVNGDTQLEPTETFTVQLSGAANSLVTTASAIGTITDDDAPATTPKLTLTPVRGSDTEGNSGTKTLTYAVTLDRLPTAGQPVTVDVVTVDGTGPTGAISTGASADFVAKTQTLTFLSTGAALTQEFSVTVNGDTQAESTETFNVELRNANGAVITSGSAIGTITDDDTLSTAPPILAISSVSLTEGDVGNKTFNFNISLTNGPADRAFTVNYEILDGSATLSDNDYQLPAGGRTGTVTFSPGETQKPIVVLVNGDRKLEGTETFTIQLTNPTNSASFGPGGDRGIGSILNDDLADPGNNISLDSLNDLLWRNPTTGETVLWQTNLGPTTRTFNAGSLRSYNAPEWRFYGSADFDRDGDTDPLWHNTQTGELHIWKMNGTAIDSVITDVLPSALNGGRVAAEWSVKDISDYNQDGTPDLIWHSSRTGSVDYWAMNGFRFSGGGAFQLVSDLNWKIEAVANFSGDAQKTLFWRHQQTGKMALWRMAEGRISSSSFLNFSLADTTWQVATTADLNGDGTSDLVWQNRATNEVAVWYLNRNGFIGATFLQNPGEGYRVKASGDFNQDGVADLLLQNSLTGQNQLWYFQQSPKGIVYSNSAFLGNTTPGLQFLGLGQLDRSNPPSLLWNNAAGDMVTWQVDKSLYGGQSNISGLSNSETKILATVDLNRDGKAELLVRNAITGAIELGDLTNKTYNRITLLPSLDTSWSYIGSGDADGDGDQDLYWQNQTTGKTAIWQMNGYQYVTTLSPLEVGPEYPGWRINQIADFNGDNKADFFWRNTESNATAVWIMDGAAIQSSAFMFNVDQSWKIVKSIDLDRDGNVDLLWRNSETGQNSVWLMNGSALKRGIVLPTVADLNWQIKEITDFDRDGNADILWYNSRLQTAVFWKLNNGQFVNDVFLPKAVSSSWDLVGTRDFNADGSRDLLWLDKATGTPIIWFMNDTKYGTSASLPNLSSPNFQLIGIDDYAQTPT